MIRFFHYILSLFISYGLVKAIRYNVNLTGKIEIESSTLEIHETDYKSDKDNLNSDDQFKKEIQENIEWLHETVIQLEKENLTHIVVSHRGYHHDNLGYSRPIEDSLAAYERAWSEGVRHCECDITSTKDGRIIIIHDDTLKRTTIPLKYQDKHLNEAVESETYKEIMKIPLLSGTITPLLKSVYQSANILSEGETKKKHQLLVELKLNDLTEKGFRFFSETFVPQLETLYKENLHTIQLTSIFFSFYPNALKLWVKTFHNDILKPYKIDNDHKPDYMLLIEEGTIDYLIKRKYNPDAINVKMLKDLYDDSSDPNALKNKIKEILHVEGDLQLDGIYLEWTPVLTDKRYENFMKALCKICKIGVWSHHSTVDNIHEIKRLSNLGVSYVNTDFPDTFFIDTKEFDIKNVLHEYPDYGFPLSDSSDPKFLTQLDKKKVPHEHPDLNLIKKSTTSSDSEHPDSQLLTV